MYTLDFIQISSSRFRNVITGSLYDDNWNDFLIFLSGSENTLSNSELQKFENWLTTCENSPTGSLWFEVMLGENGGSFK